MDFTRISHPESFLPLAGRYVSFLFGEQEELQEFSSTYPSSSGAAEKLGNGPVSPAAAPEPTPSLPLPHLAGVYRTFTIEPHCKVRSYKEH